MAFGMKPVCLPSWPEPPASHGTAPVGQALVELLDEMAWSLGVTPLSVYTDDRLLPDELQDDPEQALLSLGPRDDWHPLAQGL